MSHRAHRGQREKKMRKRVSFEPRRVFLSAVNSVSSAVKFPGF